MRKDRLDFNPNLSFVCVCFFPFLASTLAVTLGAGGWGGDGEQVHRCFWGFLEPLLRRGWRKRNATCPMLTCLVPEPSLGLPGLWRDAGCGFAQPFHSWAWADTLSLGDMVVWGREVGKYGHQALVQPFPLRLPGPS